MRSVPEARYTEWRTVTSDYVVKAFGTASRQSQQFENVGSFSCIPGNADENWYTKQRFKELGADLSNLRSFINILNTDFELEDHGSRKPTNIGSNSVFIVHGHDHAALHSVARFIEHLGLVPIILHEQPNRGQTTIEKFVSSSQVGFAVVLLTPDDVGRSVKANPNDEKARARQNVVLELGYFMGTIGRARVCPLCVAGVEIPSDYLGTVYTPLDDGEAWKLKLARELKAAEFAVDLNRAM